MGRDAEERGEKRRERRVEMKHHSVSAVEHWTASEARKKREIAIRKDERMKVLDDSLERLSAIEHEQWIEWSKNIASTEPNISFERVERWSNLWIPYEQLSDEMKEHDRKWARKIIKALRQAGEP